MRRNIETNRNHPSVFTWSVGNELVLAAGPGAGRLHHAARPRSPSDIDPTRPTSIAFAGYPSAGCQREYAPLDIIGVNEYFGWYPGPGGKIVDRTGLGALPRPGPRAATRSRRSW